MINELDGLANFETLAAFLRSLERSHSYPANSFHIERVLVNRENIGKAAIDCLVIDVVEGLHSANEAVSIITDWMQFKHLDYYRIVAPTSHSAQ